MLFDLAEVVRTLAETNLLAQNKFLTRFRFVLMIIDRKRENFILNFLEALVA